MPASRAAWSGSPWAIAPRRINPSASALIVMAPRATASREVTAFSPMSTILTRPAASTWDSRAAARGRRDLATSLPLRQKERQTLQRHGQIDALEFHVVGHLERAGREVENRLDAGGHDLVDHRLRRRSGHRDDRDVDAIAAPHPLELLDIVDRNAGARLVGDLLVRGIEERRDFEPFLPEPRIVGQGQAEVAGAHDRDPKLSIETENLPQVAAEILDVVADAPDAELAEVRQVLPDLRRIEVELFGEGLRGDGLHASGVELVEAAQVHGKAIGGELRDLVGRSPPLVHPIHKTRDSTGRRKTTSRYAGPGEPHACGDSAA